jgi:HSP20 family molecular chaperone IbpA
VAAKLVNGVLSFTFPKGEEAKPRKIEVSSGD